MADKKFIRDLNSLIRFPHRKRLKTADMRAGIEGGTGIAEEGQDEVVVDKVWWNHHTNLYVSEPGVARVNAGAIGVRFNIARNGGVTFSTTGSQLYKDGSSIVSGFVNLQGMSSNSTEVFVVDALVDNSFWCYVYDHSGVLQRSFTVAPDASTLGGQVRIAANETHFVCSCVQRGYLYTKAGALVTTLTIPEFAYSEEIAITSDRAYFMTLNAGSFDYEFRVLDMAGADLGTVTMADDLSHDTPTALEVTGDGLWILSVKIISGDRRNVVTYWPKSAVGEGFDTPFQQETYLPEPSLAEYISKDRDAIG